MPTLLRSALLLALLAPVQAFAQQDDVPNYAVTLRGDTLRTDVKLRDPLVGRSFVEVDGEEWRIEAFKSLHLDGVTHAVVEGRRLAPLLAEGRVRVYGYPSSDVGGMMMGPDGQFLMAVPVRGVVDARVGYFQMESGPVLKATPAALHSAIGSYEPSARYLRRSQTLRRARWAVTGVGAATFLAGVALTRSAGGGEEEAFRYAPILFVGAGTALAGHFLLPDMAKSMRNKAIDAYNAAE